MILRLFLFNVALVLVAVLLILGSGFSLQLTGALYLITVSIMNVILLHRDRVSENRASETPSSPLYLCAAIYFAGFLYGIFMILVGELPRTTLLVVPAPLLISFHCFRLARRRRLGGG